MIPTIFIGLIFMVIGVIFILIGYIETNKTKKIAERLEEINKKLMIQNDKLERICKKMIERI